MIRGVASVTPLFYYANLGEENPPYFARAFAIAADGSLLPTPTPFIVVFVVVELPEFTVGATTDVLFPPPPELALPCSALAIVDVAVLIGDIVVGVKAEVSLVNCCKSESLILFNPADLL